MDLSRYADLFLTESREHLSALNHQLLQLERTPTALEPVGAIFRAVHTVKGMAATMGYQAVATLAHELESLLDRVRRGELRVTATMMDLFFRAADALEVGIEHSVQGASGTVDVVALVEALRAYSGPAPTVVPGAAASETPATPAGRASGSIEALGDDGEAAGRLVRVRLAEETALRGPRAVLVIKRAETLGIVTAVTPSLEAMLVDTFGHDFTFRLQSPAAGPEIEATLRAVGDVEQVEVEERRVRGTGLRDAERGDESRAPTHVRIALRRLDTLMNLVGELVIARGRLQQIAGAVGQSTLDETVAQTSRLIAELQEEIMQSRMVPVAQVFDRFPRLVRDAARALEKQIEFTIEGQGIELDRSMLDEIGDPLMHLLRNAIDHGIESPVQRQAAGKPPVGRLSLVVTRERSAVTVLVQDDGRGIDRGRVLRKARELGLVPADTTRLLDDEVFKLIARPGFSTAETVTDLSGRGVGIDVVVTRVRALGGSVDIRSVEGEGTQVVVRLPVTLAIVRALLARVDQEVYAVPMTHVRETVELDARAITRLQGRDVLLLRDDVLPVIRFRELVHLAPAEGRARQVIVLAMGDRRAGLVVDELTGQQDIVVKQFDAVRDGVAVFSGATILADGAPALIVDVGSIL